MILDGKVVAQSFKDQISKKVEELSKKNQTPTLAIVQLMEEESLEIYLGTRTKIAEKLGIKVIPFKLFNSSFEEIKKLVEKLNNDDTIWGIMIDRPIPRKFNEDDIVNLMDPKKDIEGCTWENGGKLLYCGDTVTAPTATAILEILKYYNVPMVGKKAVVVGRSKAVGSPCFQLLLKENATCTLCHSKTIDLKKETKKADILVVAIGKKEFITEEYLNDNCVLIDVGTHYNENGSICGDVDHNAYKIVKDYAPSPGGVGPVTNVMLFLNLLKLRGVM